MRGKAEFVQAEQNRKIQIEEAKANVEAARLDKEADSIRAIGQKNAEVIRAEGMAQAMDIENGKLTESYIKYLWVRNIDKGDKIYIPTESGMPLLEAKN
jgi:regulator of protease activity HflC (stomatin/prohibitin superfamily)